MSLDFASLDWSKAIPAIASAIVSIATLIRFLSGPSRSHSRLNAETEILSRLPEDSDLYRAMAEIVSESIEKLANARNGTRDIPMFVVSMFAAPGLTYLAIYLVQKREWWSWAVVIPVGILAILFIYGIFETAASVPRDKAGKRVAD